MNLNLTLVGQTLTFALFVWFCMKYVWPPIVGALETRRRTIVDGLAAAERGQHELDLAARRAAGILREARQGAAEILARADEHSLRIVDDAREAARAEGGRQLAAARAEIELEVLRAREQLRGRVARLVVAAAEKVVAREVDARTHADLIETALNEL